MLRLDAATNKLHLTSKPILVNNDFTIVSTWAEAVEGAVTEGVVVKVSSEGVLLQLWGAMRGWVPRTMLSTEPIADPEKLFFLGQAVKCRVVEAEEARDRLTLSLVLASMRPLGAREKASQRLELGAEVRGRVAKVTEKGAEVEVEEGGEKCKVLLPTSHLCDHPDLSPALLEALAVGAEVVGRVWHKDVVTLLTMKPSLVDRWADLPTCLEQYTVGTIVPGVVQKVKKFGVFLQVPGLAKFVLAPTRLVQDFYLEAVEEVVEQGMTLLCKVMEVDREEGKVTVSTAVKEVAGREEDGSAVLADWLDTCASLPSAWLGEVAVGKVVMATVTAATEFGALVEVEGGVRGVVTASNMAGGAVEVGASLQGVVLHVDRRARCVELGCLGRLVGRAAGRRGGLGAAGEGERLRGEVVAVKTELSLAVVSVTAPRQHAGLLAFLPTRRCLNDLAGLAVEEGGEVAVVVRRVTARGELVVVTEKEARRGKRGRQDSVGEGGKRARRESEVVAETAAEVAEVVTEVAEVKKKKQKKNKKSETVLDKVSEEKEEVVTEAVEAPKKKRKKEKNKPTELETTPDVEMSDVEPTEFPATEVTKSESKKAETKETVSKETEVKEPVAKLSDPGWDYSATSISRPAWRAASIWSDEEEEQEEEQKSHLSKAEAKRRRRAEEEEAARREQRLLDGEVGGATILNTTPIIIFFVMFDICDICQVAKPETEEEFERLVVASPDSSLVWVQYMACCMQVGCCWCAGAGVLVCLRAGVLVYWSV